VIEVLRGSYDGWHGEHNEAMWEWKFEHNPDGAAHIWLGEEDGQIAGCYILTPVMMRAGRDRALGAQSVDAAVNPDFRGRGVFTQLAEAALREAAEAGVQIVFAFPSEGAFGGQVRVGYKPQLELPKAYRPLLWPPSRRGAGGFTVGEPDGFDERFEVFSERGGVAGEISLLRDARYLRWRFDEHPTQSYERLTCERDGEMRGYCVLRIRRGGHMTVGYVVDLQVLPGDNEAARFLVRHALRRLHALGARVAITWERPSGASARALRGAGFSSRYASLRGGLRREGGYVEQLIAFYADDRRPCSADAMSEMRWSLVPADADYF
jgi:ribosomal protein S18 acetylase RimI-like enzyme